MNINDDNNNKINIVLLIQKRILFTNKFYNFFKN